MALDRPRLLAFTLLSAVLFLSPTRSAQASAFQNPAPGTAANARAGAFVAGADDSSAAWHNPAALAFLESGSFMLAPTFANPRTTFRSPGGVEDSAAGAVHLLPNAFLALPFSDSPLTLGLGLTTPWGMSSRWSREGPLRYELTESGMKTVNLNPSLAWQVSPALSLALGVNYLHSEIEEKAAFPLGPPPAPDGAMKLRMTGHGWGYNLGLLWKPAPGSALGLAWRSPVRVAHTGRLVTDPAMPVPAAASMDMDFPATASAGYAFSPAPGWRLEAAVEWTGWSRLRGNTLEWAMGPSSPYEGWRDTWSPRFGATREFNPRWRGFAGCLYLPSPVPDRAFHPRIPGGHATVLSLGAEWRRGDYRAGLSQMFSFPRSRTVESGQPIDGRYRFFNHVFSVSLAREF